jgi:FtsX-like permease family
LHPIGESLAIGGTDVTAAGPVQQAQAVTWLLGSLARLALVLSAVGIDSVTSYSVSQRRHEIGIRIALGASDGGVASMVARRGLLLAAVGLGIGLLGAWAMGRIFSGLPFEVRRLRLFDVRPSDPLILAFGFRVSDNGCHVGTFSHCPPRGEGRSHGGAAIRVIAHEYLSMILMRVRPVGAHWQIDPRLHLRIGLSRFTPSALSGGLA